MIFSQAAQKDSLRDLAAAFNVQINTHYHLPSRSRSQHSPTPTPGGRRSCSRTCT
jgi:hypothetical protein